MKPCSPNFFAIAFPVPAIWKGTTNEAKLGAAVGVYVTVPKGEGGKLQTKVERTDPLIAPLAKGQRVGFWQIAERGGLVRHVPSIRSASCEPDAIVAVVNHALTTSKLPFPDALRLGLQRVLCAPGFLFLEEYKLLEPFQRREEVASRLVRLALVHTSRLRNA